MRLLVIEDDLCVSKYIAKGLRETGHAVDTALDGRDGLFMATAERYDCIIMDRMLPTLDGLTILKTLRGAENCTPVIILSALSDVDDRVQGLRAGGDDYITKPFAFTELLARIEALGRRQAASGTETMIMLRAADLEMNLLTREVRRDGDLIDLQQREFRLLEYLLQHKGQIVTRTMLLEAVWDYHFDPQTNVIDVHISRLRKKIGDRDAQLIKTIRGAGYVISDAI
ncbi:MAG: DNA-binding response regulator [Rickettsiales bacterium]|nr:DNA-binding response regulator [Rickettsiales bacterium]